MSNSHLKTLRERVDLLESRQRSALSELLTPQQLSEQLGQTERTLAEWRVRGDGPAFIRVGKSVRYRVSVVDAWLLEREFPSTAAEVR